MTFKQSLHKAFGPRVQALRMSRRGKSRAAARHRFLLRTELLEDRLAPAILTVNSTADNTTDTNHLTLREAILASEGSYTPTRAQLNQISSGLLGTGSDTIQFDPLLDGRTINLSNTDPSSAIGPTAFTIGNVAGNETLVIDAQTGLTKGITIAGAGGFRLFDVTSGSNLTLQGLTLTGGDAQGFDGGSGLQPGGGSAGLGGAVFNQGTLTILDSTLTGNTAQGGSGGAFSATKTYGVAAGPVWVARGPSSSGTDGTRWCQRRTGGGPERASGTILDIIRLTASPYWKSLCTRDVRRGIGGGGGGGGAVLQKYSAG